MKRGNEMKFANMFIILACLYSATSFAIDSPTWVGPSKIEVIDVQPSGNIYLKLAVSTPDLGCTGNADTWLELNTGADHFKEQFSVLLAAHMANRDIKVHVSSCGYYPHAMNTQLY